MKKLFSKRNFVLILQTYFIILLILYMYGFFEKEPKPEEPEPQPELADTQPEPVETKPKPAATPPQEPKATESAAVAPTFVYSFNVPGILYETTDMRSSKSQYWWLNSGGTMTIENGIGKTVQGDLGPLDRWKIAYGLNNPTDTDDGLHPQNLFRLFTRNAWENFSEQIYFKVNKDNLSDSPNRNISNGVFLILRFRDRDDLYYTGVRVDGTAIIKKKLRGEYFTIAQKKIWKNGEYDRESNPSLLPKNQWIGMKSEINTDESGKVSIKFFLDEKGDGNWKLIFDEIDDGQTYGGEAVVGPGSGGLRSDFMDIEFHGFEVREVG